MEYHRPVMLDECVEGLAIKPDGIYVDVTFGGGGHSREILKHLSDKGRLLSFDQDEDAWENAASISHPGFQMVKSNFRHLKRYLKLYGVDRVDGILADLGISSHQIDEPERGFSTRFDAELDMRMDQQGTLTARDVVNTYSEAELHKIFGIYGELRNARSAAGAIVANRTLEPIETVNELKNVLQKLAPRGKENRYYAQVFQALRIEVNDEMGALEDMMRQAQEILSPEGRLVVMSYHSLEDRMVKNYMAKGKAFGELEKDFYGNPVRPMKPVTRKPVLASEKELKENSRARSAKLRIAEKI
ncbi:MAG: 16S rRNA (cytosine(1402)-N(4))-methyltransferase RsmH [Cytophagales bacterium]|nr:16S rRNA (cytosine(1402)-N(4))-methyltransferase RsmH [Cytophagales bacterium]